MAMTGRLITSAYRKDAYDLKDPAGNPAVQGVPINLSNNFCNITPAPANLKANGVTMNSIIELVPSGLYHNGQSTRYYSADTVATLQTNGT
jgi:hypothetical protein